MTGINPFDVATLLVVVVQLLGVGYAFGRFSQRVSEIERRLGFMEQELATIRMRLFEAGLDRLAG